MKQYLDKQQTAKLIELGLPKPKSKVGGKVIYEPDADLEIEWEEAYSIGELIEMLPNDDIATASFEYDGFNWYVDWDLFDKIHQTSGVELIDALYAMILKLKEEGVI